MPLTQQMGKQVGIFDMLYIQSQQMDSERIKEISGMQWTNGARSPLHLYLNLLTRWQTQYVVNTPKTWTSSNTQMIFTTG